MNMNIRTMTSSETPRVAEHSAAKKHLGDRRCIHHFHHDIPGPGSSTHSSKACNPARFSVLPDTKHSKCLSCVSLGQKTGLGCRPRWTALMTSTIED